MFLSRKVIPYALFFSSFVSTSVAQTTLSTVSTTAVAITTTSTTGPPSSQTTAAPACANSCVQTALLTQSCAPADQACLCSYSTSVQESIYNCLAISSTCSQNEKDQAFQYFPTYCKALNYAIETNAPTVFATHAGSVPTVGLLNAQSASLSGQPSATQTGTSSQASHNNAHGLRLPAILGIVLAVLVVLIIAAVLILWSCLRRRQMDRRPRMDLGAEFIESRPRPTRSESNKSEFMVQSSSVEKDPFGEAFGEALSRSSTLVPPPPIAKDGKRSSDEKRNSARGKALKILLGSDGTRLSSLSSRVGSKQSSLMVPPLDIRKSQEQELRMSKF